MGQKSEENTIDKYYEINDIVNEYRIKKVLGEGRYGIVYLAEDKSDEKFIIKQLKKDMLLLTREKLFYEETILKSLNYPFFPKFVSKFNDKFREGYILEYIEGSVMEDLLTETSYVFTKDEIYHVCRQLLVLVEVLHSHNIVHRDIRPPNVVRMNNNELALIDFGLARNINNDRYTKDLDYWFIGDFLIHLFYSSYIDTGKAERPWFEELDLMPEEIRFLKKLMGIEGSYQNIDEIKIELEKIKL
jgi:serine/threonine protein kinase